MTTTMNRRKFVAAAAGTAVIAAAAGVGGELLIGKRFPAVIPSVQAAAGGEDHAAADRQAEAAAGRRLAEHPGPVPVLSRRTASSTGSTRP